MAARPVKARTFTADERRQLREWWEARTPEGEAVWQAGFLCQVFGCSSKTLVREVKALGMDLRKPQRRWGQAA